jgi:hypothetical protein
MESLGEQHERERPDARGSLKRCEPVQARPRDDEREQRELEQEQTRRRPEKDVQSTDLPV